MYIYSSWGHYEQYRELPCMYLFHDLLSLNWYPTIEAKFVGRKLLARINDIKVCLFCILVSFGKTSSNWILLAASNPLFSAEGYCVKWNDEVVFWQLVQMHLFGFQKNWMTLAIGLGHAILWYPPWNEKKTSQELRMLSRSLSDCKSLTHNVMIQVSKFVSSSQLCH